MIILKNTKRIINDLNQLRREANLVKIGLRKFNLDQDGSGHKQLQNFEGFFQPSK